MAKSKRGGYHPPGPGKTQGRPPIPDSEKGVQFNIRLKRPLLARLKRVVPEGKRTRFVAKAIAEKLERETAR